MGADEITMHGQLGLFEQAIQAAPSLFAAGKSLFDNAKAKTPKIVGPQTFVPAPAAAQAIADDQAAARRNRLLLLAGVGVAGIAAVYFLRRRRGKGLGDTGYYHEQPDFWDRPLCWRRAYSAARGRGLPKGPARATADQKC